MPYGTARLPRKTQSRIWAFTPPGPQTWTMLPCSVVAAEETSKMIPRTIEPATAEFPPTTSPDVSTAPPTRSEYRRFSPALTNGPAFEYVPSASTMSRFACASALVSSEALCTKIAPAGGAYADGACGAATPGELGAGTVVVVAAVLVAVLAVAVVA